MAHIKTFYKKLLPKINVIVAIMLLSIPALKAEEPVFKFFLTSAPQSLNPAQFYGTESSYLVSNLFRGLYRYDNEKGIVPEGAKACAWKAKIFNCTLNPDVKWSDGIPVKAQDYERAFRNLINPESKSREIAHLLKLKNAKKILTGEMKPELLGVKAKDDFTLIFEFETKDPEFIARLTSNVLIPWRELPNIDKASEALSNGPYKIKTLDNKKILLEKNTHYPFGNKDRPNVEVYYIEEDVTGQNLFDLGKINLIHQLNTAFIPKYKDSKGFFQVVFSRLDYIGFGPDLQKNIHFRKALALSVNYDEITEIMFAVGRFGCPGLTKNYINKEQCYPFDLKTAQKELKKVPKELLSKKLVFKYSRAGGDNISRMAEWYQNQWKKNLGLEISLESAEQGMYLQDLASKTPDLFRKGVVMDRPTCLSTLESFQKDNPDNFIKFKSVKFENILKKLEVSSGNENKKLCEAGIKILMDEYRIIPQGLIHFTMLKDDKFEGFVFNELNQLDLSNLRIKK